MALPHSQIRPKLAFAVVFSDSGDFHRNFSCAVWFQSILVNEIAVVFSDFCNFHRNFSCFGWFSSILVNEIAVVFSGFNDFHRNFSCAGWLQSIFVNEIAVVFSDHGSFHRNFSRSAGLQAFRPTKSCSGMPAPHCPTPPTHFLTFAGFGGRSTYISNTTNKAGLPPCLNCFLTL